MNPAENLVPAVGPLPLPGPPWLFHVLLVTTFFLHALFMNVALGGTLIAVWARLTGAGSEHKNLLAKRLMTINTYGISFAITTGVAPLLFLQTLYGRFFYSATILLGGAWISFLVLLLIGYYAVYLDKLRGGSVASLAGTGWLSIAAVCFLLIAMVHVAVHLVHAQPESWGVLTDRPWAVLADPSYWPRLLHFVVASLGFSALIVAWWSTRSGADSSQMEVETDLAATAWRWVAVTTAVQILGGFWLLFSLPERVLLGLMRGGAATLLPLTAAIVLGIGLLMMASRSRSPMESPGLVRGALGAMTLIIAVMSITRHQVRALYLQPFTGDVPRVISPQWGNFLLFGLLLIAALATVGAMVRAVLRNPAVGEQAA